MCVTFIYNIAYLINLQNYCLNFLADFIFRENKADIALIDVINNKNLKKHINIFDFSMRNDKNSKD
ncbi:hypothetical protein GCM10022396_06640 [Flavivirga amylovorans]